MAGAFALEGQLEFALSLHSRLRIDTTILL